jgi:hypothetical protein
MSRERREKEEAAAAEGAPANAGVTPGKRSGTANAPAEPPPKFPGKRTLTQHFAPRVGRTPLPNVDEVATSAVANKGPGSALDGAVRSTMEAHLGIPLGDVRVHTDPNAQVSAKAMGARAFAHGKDIYLAPGESPTDLVLLAHELTHVAQQSGKAPQPQRKVTVGPAGAPAELQADAVAQSVTGGEKPPMLVESGAPIQANQLEVKEFLAALREQVEAAAADKFGPLWSVAGCHYIEKYFAHYQGRSAKEIERAMKLYAPEAAASGNAQVAIAAVTARVRIGMDTWESTGELPADAAAIAPPSASTDAAEAQTAAPADAAHAMHECTAACKHAPGEHPSNPMAALGEGQALSSDVASRMGDALGADVSGARVHTGDSAGDFAKAQRATAVAIGQDIAFAPGAFQPGTLEGDALLAHELAHTVQQQGADPKQKPARESAAAEDNADAAAAGALGQLYGGGKEAAAATFGGSLAGIMSTGLALQRCSPENTKAPPVKSGAPAAAGPTRPKPIGPATDKPEVHSERFDNDKVLDEIKSGKATIKPGDKSLQATKIQQALVDLNLLPSDKVTGTMDADTVAALKAFQTKAKISPANGEVDSKTLAELQKGFDAFQPGRDAALDPSTETDPMKGTRALNDEERKAIDNVLDPQVEMEIVVDPITGTKTTKVKEPKFVDKVGGVTFEQNLRKMLNDEITSQFDTMAKGKAADRKDPKKAFDWPALEAVGAEAKREVDTVFGGYKMGKDVKQGTVLHDRWATQEKVINDAKGKGDQAKIDEIAEWRIQKIMNEVDGFRAVLKKHGAQSTRAPEKAIIDKVHKELMKSREAELLEIHKAWPGSAGGGKIQLQLFKGVDDMESRRILWTLFQTIIHEYLHTITHKTYSDYADALGPPKDQTLREGMTDVMTKTVWTNVGITDALRQKIEGPLHDAGNPVDIPQLSTYGETSQAETLMGIVGQKNCYAAYFLGKVDLIGKK